MRIGIDATSWNHRRGYGRFTRSLVRALLEVDSANEYVLFFDSSPPTTQPVAEQSKTVVVRNSRPQIEAARWGGQRSLADLWRMTLAVAREPIDLFFSPTVYTYFPLLGRFRKVVQIHDAIPELHPKLVFPDFRDRSFWRLKVMLALRQAHRIVTDSNRAREDLSRAFGVSQSAIGIIPAAPDDVFRPPASRVEVQRQIAQQRGVRPPYLLYVGGFGGHKNLPALIDQFARLTTVPKFAAYSLVLVGEREADLYYSVVEALDRQIEHLRLTGRVHFPGFVSDQELALFNQGAEVVVVPSLREGYGLPGVEAMACGTPVIATCYSPLPEILGEAAFIIDPTKPMAIRLALETVLGDLQRWSAMRAAALDRGRGLNWHASARRAMAIFTEEMDRGGRHTAQGVSVF